MDRRPLIDLTNVSKPLNPNLSVLISKSSCGSKTAPVLISNPSCGSKTPVLISKTFGVKTAPVLISKPSCGSKTVPAFVASPVLTGLHKKKSLSLSSQIRKNTPDSVLINARKVASNLMAQGFPPINAIENNSDISTIINLESDIPAPELREGSSAGAESPPNAIDLVNNSDLSDLCGGFETSSKSKSGNEVTETVSKVVIRKKAGCRKSLEEIEKNVEKAREESLANPAFEKVHEKLPSLMADYVIIDTSSKPNPFNETEEHWTAKIRVNITDKSGAYQWLSDYENKSSCDFRVKKTKKENSDRLVFKREYRCHHNTIPRERPDKTKTTFKTKAAKVRKSKNTSCPSFVRITIKQRSMAWSSDDLLKDYPCEIIISHQHNHPIDSADALRYRRPSNEVKEKFLKMFSDGHSVLSAIETYKFDLLLSHGADYMYTAADGSKCPSNYWVYKLFRKVSIGHYGPQSGEGMVEALKDFCCKYNTEVGDQCIKVEIQDERDLIVAICTPMMKRAHELLRSAGEMIFVDSSGTMDVLNCRVFLLLTPSVAGALPLGILVVSSESEDVLKPAIDVLKSLLPSKAFYGRGPDTGPKIAMADDCDSERNSLKSAFPGIILLLCLFHVLQAFWRYVWKRENDVPLKHRPEIFYVMKDLAYAKDQPTFLDLVKNAKENPLLLSNKKIYDHIIKYVDRSHEWALFQREDLLTRGNDTNNYAEATMRIIKDKVLGRVKAFNPVQLVDFLVTRFPAYIEMRITDVLNNRSLNPFQSRYFIRPEKLENLVTEKLPNLPHCYKVTNKAKGTAYIVLMENELCSCPEGKSGKPCKHQCAVVKNYKLSSAQFLPREQTGTEIKLALFEILHGHRKVPSGWFCGLHDYLENNSPEADDSSNTVSSLTYESETNSQEDPNQEIPSPASSSDLELPNPEDVLAAEEKLKEMFSGWLQNLKKRPALFLDPVNVMLKSNNKIKDSDSGLVSAFMTFGKSGGTKPLSVKKLTQSTIPAQSTAKSRRKVHLGGCHAQTGGRPLLASLPPATQENNYHLPPKRKSNEPHWAIIPKRKYPAPHSVSLCVSTNRMIGSNHSKKN